MNRIVRVAVSQRVDVWPDREERRDALDQRLGRWLLVAGYLQIAVPNSYRAGGDHVDKTLATWLKSINPDAILLSGGNDIGSIPERDCTERRLLEFAKDKNLPLLGICRGMQMMGVWAGSTLQPQQGHVGTRHRLQTDDQKGRWPEEVNSYHDYVLTDCPPNFVITARSEDGAIEAIRHHSLPWEGWMWHPEREPGFQDRDTSRLKSLFGE